MAGTGSYRNIILVISAFLLSVVISEIIVRYVIGYPAYGLEKKVMGIRASSEGIQNIYYPYSEYINVEGSFLKEKRNNIGLPGTDVRINDTAKYIFILGDSFIEALQVPREKMSASVFQMKLDSAYKNKYSVLNLGYSGHDPFDLYLRAIYYSKYYDPSYVYLVLEGDYSEWLQRHSNFNFEPKANIGEEIKDKNNEYQKFFRNKSCYLNLVITALKSNFKDNKFKNKDDFALSNPEKLAKDYKDFQNVILNFYRIYNGKLIVISQSNEDDFNNFLSDLCNENKISFYYSKISISENRIKGEGHLNEAGNFKLGSYFFEVFQNNQGYE